MDDSTVDKGLTVFFNLFRNNDEPDIDLNVLFTLCFDDRVGEQTHSLKDTLVGIPDSNSFGQFVWIDWDFDLRCGAPSGAKHRLEAWEERPVERFRVGGRRNDRSLNALHPSLETRDPCLGANYTRSNAVYLSRIEWPEKREAIARVFERLIVPKQKLRLREMDQLLHP